MGQLVLKTHHLKSLKLSMLGSTTADNRSQLLEFAAQAVNSSKCLNSLHIESTYSSETDGEKFMKAIADDRINCLHSLTIVDEKNWFEGRDDCVDSLVTLIARQSELKFLNLVHNGFTEEQEQKARSAVANTACRVISTVKE